MIPVARAVVSAVLGAAAMYWFDPLTGRRRRALLRERLVSVGADVGDTVGVAGRDLSHRARGLGARLRSSSAPHEVTDEVLVERVRAALGRAVSHPGAIEVHAADGQVTLAGSVLAEEYSTLLEVVLSVQGVADVLDELAVYDSAEGIPELQGGRPRPRPRSALMQQFGSPAGRLLTSASGGALLLFGTSQLFGPRKRGLLGSIAIATGGWCLASAATSARLRQVAGRAGIDVQKSILVEAAVPKVFEVLTHPENFPSFMRNVRDVRRNPDGTSHWTVAGPAGVPVEWDARTTIHQPNEVIAWQTIGNGSIAHSGFIRLDRAGTGTRVHIRMTYNPPAGVLGHAAAKLFGVDPKTELNQDLLRLKTFIETGVTAHDAARGSTETSTDQPPREVH